MKFKVEHRYVKPPVDTIKDKAEEVIPYGHYCIGDGAKCSNVGKTECPFLQWRRRTAFRLKEVKDIPYGNIYLQYCSYLKKYLDVQDCVKDCRIKHYWPEEEEEVEKVIEKINIKEKYNLLEIKNANKKEE